MISIPQFERKLNDKTANGIRNGYEVFESVDVHVWECAKLRRICEFAIFEHHTQRCQWTFKKVLKIL